MGRKVYGIPPEQVVGSSIKMKFELRDGKPVLMRCRKSTSSTTDRQTRRHQPAHWPPAIAAFGNSDGDLQMLEWTSRRRHAFMMLDIMRRRARIRLRCRVAHRHL